MSTHQITAGAPRQEFDRLAARLSLLLIAGGLTAALWSVPRLGKDFFNELWGPAHLLVHGNSPYDTSSLDAELPAVWLPMAIGVFAPLGWLAEPAATHIWFILSAAAVTGIMGASLGGSSSPSISVMAALSAFLFPPAINHFALGQFSLVAALCLVLAARCAHERRDWLAAGFLALGSAKPQLAFLAAIGLGSFYVFRDGAGGLLRFAGRTSIAAAAMSLPLFLAAPGWPADYVRAWSRNPVWPHPALFTVLPNWLGISGLILWAALAAAIGIAVLRLWRTRTPQAAMTWTLALTTLAAPYIWSWDFVLLLPLWVHTLAAATDWRERLALFLAYALSWVGMAAVQIHADGANQLFWWVPVWFVGAALLIHYHRRAEAAESLPA